MRSSETFNGTRISQMCCEYLATPLGIDEREPRLSWAIESNRRGARQVAWQVGVASAARRLANRRDWDLWDSSRVENNQTTHIVYAGRPLRSRQECHWRVLVWDETGKMTRSDPSFWTMGLLEKRNWRAHWIAANGEIIRRDNEAIAPTLTEPGTPAFFRKKFKIAASVKRATVYASARGLIELRLNGQRVGPDIFAPEWTDYEKRIQYRTYDVTRLIGRGWNVLGAILGDGWWSGFVGWQETRARYGSLENSLLVQLEVELAGGRRVMVGTDKTWACNTGPILSSDFMMGEIYDARREHNGWDTAAYSGKAWLAARRVAEPSAPLVAQRSEPVRITQTIKPISVNKLRPGVFIYDLGQNITGWARLRIRAHPGARIQIRHGEQLTPNGALYTENLRRARATDVYICKGMGREIWEPRFTFHGFQFVELSGLATADKNAVTGCVVHSATPPAGRFECSDARVNRLWLNGLWSQRDNFLSVPTDCPQRDERLGWMGDAQVFLRTATYN
ncbi:MAG: family 78 glycoside hydrolase catalytic domain, partial [Limisphaerales bacterium]